MYLRSFDIIIVSSLFFKNPIKIKQLCSLMQDLFVDEDHNTSDIIMNYLGSLSSSTCALTGFFWLLSHVIYLKLTRAL
mgnify:CR=1 FL=1